VDSFLEEFGKAIYEASPDNHKTLEQLEWLRNFFDEKRIACLEELNKAEDSIYEINETINKLKEELAGGGSIR
jgi:hypothetical protein